MGYTTDFEGRLEFNEPLEPSMVKYINDFSHTRRMKRNNQAIMECYPDWKKHCFWGVLGDEGEYFAYDDGNFGQMHDDSIINYNVPPKTQPGLWCQCEVTEDGKYLQWDGGEKFYDYTEWLIYLINNFFIPNDSILNGKIAWQGEDPLDTGIIIVENNHVKEER